MSAPPGSRGFGRCRDESRRRVRRRRRARRAPAGFHLSGRAAADGGARRRGARVGPACGHRGRHRYRQDLRVSAARAAARTPRDHLDRHAHAAGSAVRSRLAAARRRRRPADARSRCSKAAATICAGTGSTRRGATARATRRRSRRSKRLDSWGQASDTGDLTELEDLADDHALRAQVTSTVDNCLGQASARSSIAVSSLEARRRAQAAEVVIVNHHLLLADLALKDFGFGELLPGTDAVIVDEAHQLPDVAQQFFGWSVGTRELESLGARRVRRGARAAGALAQVDAALSALGRAVVALRVAAARPEGRTPWIAAPAALRDALPEVAEALEGAGRRRSSRSRSRARRLRNCFERSAACATRLRDITVADPERRACAGSISQQASVAVHWTPLDIGAALAARIEAQNGVWVFASATLAVGEDFSHFLQPHRPAHAADGRAAEPVRLRAQRADLPAARLAGPERRALCRDVARGDLAARRSVARRSVSAVHELPRAAARRALARGAPGAGARARAGPRLAQRAAESVSRRRQRDPARHRQLLAGRRRARPRAAARDDRQAAVRGAERSARAGASRGDSQSGRRCVQRAAAAASRAGVETRRRAG